MLRFYLIGGDMKSRIILILVALLVLSGCASKASFVYECPTEGLDKGKGRVVAAVARIVDERKSPESFDNFYEGNPSDDLQPILEHELFRTDVFKQVVSANDIAPIKGDVLIEPTLNKLQWQVPDYDSLRAKAFLFGFFTGIIGGTIYGYTDTDVYGDSDLHLRVTEVSSGRVVLDKSYTGRYEQEIIKFKCDLPETRVMVAEKSLLKALETIKSDIVKVLGKLNEGERL